MFHIFIFRFNQNQLQIPAIGLYGPRSIFIVVSSSLRASDEAASLSEPATPVPHDRVVSGKRFIEG
jgi:hypothetical protein